MRIPLGLPLGLPSGPHPSPPLPARPRAGSGLRARFFLLPTPRTGATCVGCGAYGPWPASGEVDVLDVSNSMVDVSVCARVCVFLWGLGPVGRLRMCVNA